MRTIVNRLTATWLSVLILCFLAAAACAGVTTTLAGAGASVTVPFDLIDNHIVVSALLNGKGPFRFGVDTGGIDSITPDAANAASLPAPTQRRRWMAVNVDTAVVGDMCLRNLALIRMAFPELIKSEPIQDFAGLWGREFFDRFAVTIDYANRTLTVCEPGKFVPPKGERAIPIDFNNGVPQISGAVLDGRPVRLVIDTGSRLSLLTVVSPTKDHSEPGGPRTQLRVVGWGVGGPVRGRVSRAQSLSFGGFTIDQPVVAAIEPSGGGAPFGAFGGAVNLGGEILKKFTITFDYAHSMSYWKPNSDFPRVIPADESGLWLNPSSSEGFSVADVMPGSPGALAGVLVGDRVVAVDGTPAAQVDLSSLRQRLAEDAPGTSVTLMVATGDAPARTCTIKLADLTKPGDSALTK